MRIVTANFRSSEQFLKHYSDAHDGGALFYRTRMELRIGERVLIEVSFPGLPGKTLVRGEVAGFDALGAGVWIRFLSEDAQARDFILGIAHGEVQVTSKPPRRHLRFPVTIAVDWRVDGSPNHYVSITEDLGAGGLFVRTLTPPSVGTDVALTIGPTEMGELIVHGKVAWIRTGLDAGMGVRFKDTQEKNTRRLRELLRHVSERGKLSFGSRAQA